MSTCSVQINIQIDFQSVKVCTFSSLSFCWGVMSPVACLVSLDVDVDVDSFSGAMSAATDDEVLAVPLLPDFDEDIDQEAEFVALLKKKDEETEALKAKPKPKPKKQIITTPSDTADKGTLSPSHMVIEIDPSEYTAELASKTREMVIAIENPDPNLEIKIDQCRPVVRTKEGAHSLLFLLLFGFHCLFRQSGRQ